MNCKNCGAKADDSQRYCPNCGEELSPQKEESPVADSNIADYAPSFDNAKPQKKKTSKLGAIITAAILILAIAAGIIGSQFINFGNNGDQIVVTMGDYKLTNRMLAYYYWNEVYYLENTYYTQYGITLDQILEAGVSFSEQEYYNEDYATWHDYFLAMAIDNWAFTVSVAEIAGNEGHSMSDVYVEYMADFDTNTYDEASYYGYASIEDMLVGDFGDYADMESYRAFREERFMASSYSYGIYEASQQLYYGGLEMTDSINIRHILIKTETAETEEDMEAFKAYAQEIYDEWLLDPTEANFAVLAGTHTEDTGSLYNGGLYEEVAPGEMVTEFDEWCFAEGRKAGDSGIVQTTFGFHIMYFSGFGTEQVPADIYAASAADTQAQNDYMEWLNGVFDTLDFEVKHDKIQMTKTSF